FYAYTSFKSGYVQLDYSGCVALKAVYWIYVNGSWKTFESDYSTNLDVTNTNSASRCPQYSPETYDNQLFPGCPDFPGPPPKVVTAPTVSSTQPNAITVSWTPSGFCQPTAPGSCTPPSALTCPAGHCSANLSRPCHADTDCVAPDFC